MKRGSRDGATSGGGGEGLLSSGVGEAFPEDGKPSQDGVGVGATRLKARLGRGKGKRGKPSM